MNKAELLMAMVSLALLMGCGDSSRHGGTAGVQTSQGLDTNLTIREALAQRNENSTDILLEASIAAIPAVREGVGQLRKELANRRANNSICVGGRAAIGRTAFTCNDYDYDLLILARRAGQSISSNLRYIAEFADDPLRAGLVEAIKIVSAQSIDDTEADCVRLVFRDPASGKVRKGVPIIVTVRAAKPDTQEPEDKHLRACLE